MNVLSCSNQKTFLTPLFFSGLAVGSLSKRDVAWCAKSENSEGQSLEDKYSDSFKDVNIHEKVNFKKFHSPNERHVRNIRPHLAKAGKGVIVSTGTERSFFELALQLIGEKGDQCTGLVIRDIDPQAIAYTHMVTMMLRIAKDVKDFDSLSGPVRKTALTKDQIDEKAEEIRKRLIDAQDIPEKAKTFYLKYLNDFASIYFRTNNRWRLCGGDEISQKYWESRKTGGIPKALYASSFQGVQYHKDEKLFKELQKFAKSGNIISTVGSINDLQFLNQDRLSVVDMSNIPDYIPMALRCDEPCSPVVIWNVPKSPFLYTQYRSYIHDSNQDTLSSEEKKEFDQLTKELKQANVMTGYLVRLGLKEMLQREDRPFGYYPEHLNAFRKYKQQWMVYHPKQGWVSLGPSYVRTAVNKSMKFPPGSALKTKSVKELQEIAKLPEMVRFVPYLVSLWPYLEKEKYLAFSEVLGWKEAFQKECELQSANLEFQVKLGPKT